MKVIRNDRSKEGRKVRRPKTCYNNDKNIDTRSTANNLNKDNSLFQKFRQKRRNSFLRLKLLSRATDFIII